MNISFLGQLKLNYISPYDPKPRGRDRFPGGIGPYDRPYRRNMYPFDNFFRNRRYPFDNRYMDRYDWNIRRPYDRYGRGYARPLPPPVKGQL